MDKYPKLRRLAAVSDKDLQPFGDQTDILRDEAQALLSERDRAVELLYDLSAAIAEWRPAYPAEQIEEYEIKIDKFLHELEGK